MFYQSFVPYKERSLKRKDRRPPFYSNLTFYSKDRTGSAVNNKINDTVNGELVYNPLTDIIDLSKYTDRGTETNGTGETLHTWETVTIKTIINDVIDDVTFKIVKDFDDFKAVNNGVTSDDYYIMANDINCSDSQTMNETVADEDFVVGKDYTGLFPIVVNYEGNRYIKTRYNTGYIAGDVPDITGENIDYWHTYNYAGFVLDEFAGVFSGNGYTLNNYYANRIDAYGGAFSKLNGAKVSNLNISGSIIGHSGYAGGLIGEATNSSEMNNICSNCYVVGYSNFIGGLLGRISASSSVNRSCSKSIVKNYEGRTGGLIGYALTSAIITNSYSTGSVTGYSFYTGGLIGLANSSTITNSYATGLVTGLVSYIGGLIGGGSSTITNSYWDKNTSGQTTSSGGTGLTTAQMKDIDSYLPEWDFGNTWAITDSYPFLRMEDITLANPISNFKIVNNYDGYVIMPSEIKISVEGTPASLFNRTDRNIYKDACRFTDLCLNDSYVEDEYSYYWHISELNTATILSYMNNDYKNSWFVKNTFDDSEVKEINEIFSYSSPVTDADDLAKIMTYLGLGE